MRNTKNIREIVVISETYQMERRPRGFNIDKIS